MSDDFLHDTGKSLVEAFFIRENAQVLRKFQEKQAKDLQASELAKATGITDEATLQQLVDKNISTEAIAAFGIYPLIAVAWADGKMDESERTAVLKAAADNGIAPGSNAHEVLLNWLQNKPDPALFEAWEAYTKELVKNLPDTHKQALKLQTIAKARTVADAAGGFLGLNTVSESEKALLDRLSHIF